MGRKFKAVLVAVMTASALLAGTSAAPVETVGSQSYIVVLQEGTGNVPAVAADLTRAHGGQVGFVYEHAIQGFSVTISPQGAAALARNPRVAYVNENRPVWAFEDSVPTGVSRIDAPKAHPSATGVGIRVAIIDTGVDSDHPDLQGNVISGYGKNCIDPSSPAEDDQGHGTHVAGTVAAVDNGSGVIGVAPGASLVPVKVLDSSGSGTWAEVICGIEHVTALNDAGTQVHVANMSLGGSGTHDESTCAAPGPDAMYQAICAAIGSGTTFVVAAGNDSRDASGFTPAAYPEVITVSAYSDTNGSSLDDGCAGRGIFKTCDEVFASFSNYGDIVDVIAPGVSINSTTLGGGYGAKSGTSMASPHVAGMAALVLGENPGLSPAQVRDHLRDTGQCPTTEENSGVDDCSNQGAWNGDSDNVTEPMVNADFAINTSTGDGTAPVAPSDLTATAVSGSAIDLAWADNAGDETGFRIERSLDGGAFSVLATVAADVTSYPDTGLGANATYTYRVAAENGHGVSGWSNTASATTQADGAEATAVTVGSLSVTTVNLEKGQKAGEATVVVVDDLGNPVEGATVTGDFSGTFNETGFSGTSDSSGTKVFTTSGSAKGNVSVIFCVTSITHHTLTGWSGTTDCASN